MSQSAASGALKELENQFGAYLVGRYPVAPEFDVLARIGELRAFGFPLLIGLSRKGFVGHCSGNANVEDRLAGTLAGNAAAVSAGAAQIIRAHEIRPHREMLDFMGSLASARP